MALSFLIFILSCSFLFYTNLPFQIISNFMFKYIIFDECSFFILVLVFLVVFSSWIIVPSNDTTSLTQLVLFMSLTLFSFLVFISQNLVLLYFMFECTILPIFYIIINFGCYPERSLSAIYLLIYTLTFSFPLLYCLIFFYFSFSTFNLASISFMHLGVNSLFIAFIFFITFSVNLPIYGVHYWLPIAHVEAPTYGSIILAGILLNLGGVGLIRCSFFIEYSNLSFLISYFILFTLVSFLVCSLQSDFNRLVAYSSVSHMMLIPILLICGNSFSYNAIILLIFTHGLSSPLLFLLIGACYLLYGTRNLVLIRSLVYLSPLLSFFVILSFLFTLSAPPFPSFLSEVFSFMSLFNFTSYMALLIVLIPLISLIYNLNWFTSLLFNFSSSTNKSFKFTFNYFLSFAIMLAFSIYSLSLLCLL